MTPPKPYLKAIPAVINDRADDPTPLFDADGRIVAFRLPDGQLLRATPNPDPNNLPPATVNDAAYFDMGLRSLQAMATQVQQVLALGELARSATLQSYAGSFMGGARAAIENFRHGQLTRQQLKASLEEGRLVLDGIQQAQRGAQALVAMTQLEGERRALTDRFGQADYDRERGRYEREAIFALNQQLQPTDVANMHELVMQQGDHAHQANLATINASLQRDLGQQQVEIAATQLTITSQDRDKDREVEWVRAMQDHHKTLNDAMAELRLIEQQRPPEQIAAAMAALGAAMTALGELGKGLSEKDRDRLTPVAMRLVDSAVDQAHRVVTRRG